MTTSPATNSYGTVTGVAGMSRMWTNAGVFDGATSPTDEIVVTWIDQVSGFMNVALANEGFVIPVVQVDALAALNAVVNQYVSDMVQGSNSSGRFYTERFLASGIGMLTQIAKDVNGWVSSNASGLESLGVVRQSSSQDTIGTKGVDGNGNPMFEIFQRDAFGNKFENWGNN